MKNQKTIILSTAIVVASVFIGTAVVGSLVGNKSLRTNSSVPASPVQARNNVNFDNNHEALTEILAEVRSLRAELSNLSLRVSESGGATTTRDIAHQHWWKQKNDTQLAREKNTLDSLISHAPRKRDFDSEEEYQQGILDFQAELDAYALDNKNQVELQRKQAEYLQETIRIVEEDLGGSIN